MQENKEQKFNYEQTEDYSIGSLYNQLWNPLQNLMVHSCPVKQ